MRGQLPLRQELRSTKHEFGFCGAVATFKSTCETHSMANLLSLPDEVIDIIGIATKERVGIEAWCRLASTCRRLWRLQLPESSRGCEIPPEFNIAGMSQH